MRAIRRRIRSGSNRTGKNDEADTIVAFLDSLTGQAPEVTLPILPAETPRPPAENLPR